MKTITWETSLDFKIFDTVDQFHCGDSHDIHPMMSEVLDWPSSITMTDSHGGLANFDVTATEFDPTGLCKVYGTVTRPWGIPEKFFRYDLFTEDLINSRCGYTNRAGSFFFYGVPGETMKLKFAKDGKYYWFAIPDKTEIQFDTLVDQYGYVTQATTFPVAQPYSGL